jgi:RNA polymerase subunit RPABC4/transcription elongation factor Spt4
MSTNALGNTLSKIHYVIAGIVMAAMLTAGGILFAAGVSGPHLDCGYLGGACGTSSSSAAPTVALIGILVGFAVLFLLLTKYAVAVAGLVTSAMLLLGTLSALAWRVFSNVACGLNDGTQDFSGCVGHGHSPLGLAILAAVLIAGVSLVTMKKVRRESPTVLASVVSIPVACGHCHQPLTAGAAFCRHCGNSTMSGMATSRCSHCAAPLAGGAKFCRQCGSAQ